MADKAWSGHVVRRFLPDRSIYRADGAIGLTTLIVKDGDTDANVTATPPSWSGRPGRGDLTVLDVGCSTGLFGAQIRPFARRQVLPAAVRRLAPGGILGFTVEKGADPPYTLTDSH